jgi:hypothetical protein
VTTFVYALCTPCGAIVSDLDAHALWHSRLGDLVPLVVAAVTTLDPITGTPVVAVRPPAETAQLVNAATLQAQARTALAANTTYLAAGAPTTAQAVAQVRALTQQVNALIRLAVRALDATS